MLILGTRDAQSKGTRHTFWIRETRKVRAHDTPFGHKTHRGENLAVRVSCLHLLLLVPVRIFVPRHTQRAHTRKTNGSRTSMIRHQKGHSDGQLTFQSHPPWYISSPFGSRHYRKKPRGTTSQIQCRLPNGDGLTIYGTHSARFLDLSTRCTMKGGAAYLPPKYHHVRGTRQSKRDDKGAEGSENPH